METGDKVLVLLLAKIACCFGLAPAATGALGGLGVWLLDGASRWLLGAALIALIAAIVLGGSRRTATAPWDIAKRCDPPRLRAGAENRPPRSGADLRVKRYFPTRNTGQ